MRDWKFEIPTYGFAVPHVTGGLHWSGGGALRWELIVHRKQNRLLRFTHMMRTSLLFITKIV